MLIGSVRKFIRGELKKLGYTGPLIITAVGILSELSPEFLQDLVSTGIHLRHVPTSAIVRIPTFLGQVIHLILNNPAPCSEGLKAASPGKAYCQAYGKMQWIQIQGHLRRTSSAVERVNLPFIAQHAFLVS